MDVLTGSLARPMSQGRSTSVQGIDSESPDFDRFGEAFDQFPIAAAEDVDLFLDRAPVSNRGTALDLGCGTGRVVYALSSLFRFVNGIDVSSRMLAEAQRRCEGLPNVALHRADVREVRFELEEYDYVVSHTLFHHLSGALEPVLEAVKRSVKPGGRVVFVDILAEGLMKWNAAFARRIGAVITSVSGIRRSGLRKAYESYRQATHPAWMNHLRTDRFLPRKAFLARFGAVFPGAKFTVFKREYGLVTLAMMEWDKPFSGA